MTDRYGTEGAKGDQGPQGLQGATGFQGFQGFQGSIEGASDVQLTSPTGGQWLTYDGTTWVNSTPSYLDYNYELLPTYVDATGASQVLSVGELWMQTDEDIIRVIK